MLVQFKMKNVLSFKGKMIFNTENHRDRYGKTRKSFADNYCTGI